MRVLIDTNIFLSYLGRSRNSGTVVSLVEAAFSGQFTLLISERLTQEILSSAIGKTKLSKRITVQQAETLFSLLKEVAHTIPPITETIPPIGRDINDDYLLAYAHKGSANYLVTGDDDLLALGSYKNTIIVSPAQFVAILRREFSLEWEITHD